MSGKRVVRMDSPIRIVGPVKKPAARPVPLVVFVARFDHYDGSEILGLFTTAEAAMEKATKVSPFPTLAWTDEGGGYWSAPGGYCVYEMGVQE